MVVTVSRDVPVLCPNGSRSNPTGKREERNRFDALVESLREQRPQVYAEEAHYCLQWRLALLAGKEIDLVEVRGDTNVLLSTLIGYALRSRNPYILWLIRCSPPTGASAIQCCYAATERRESSTLTDTGESKNANVTLRNANKSIVDEKISLNVSRLVTNPACMAGVLSSRPNFSAL